jgi:hypothetical protein
VTSVINLFGARRTRRKIFAHNKVLETSPTVCCSGDAAIAVLVRKEHRR